MFCSSACKNCPAEQHACNNGFGESEVRLRVELVKQKNVGYGVFAGQTISRDSFITEFCGAEIESIQKRRTTDFIVRVGEASFLDATKEGSIARFLNHSCVPNCHARKR